MLSSLILPQDPLGQLPPAASTFAGEIDGLFYFLFWISVFFFALILGLLVYSAVKHRRKSIEQPAASNVTHNTPLEVVWTLIPTIILMVIFAWGFRGNQDQLIAPADALQYRVQAQKWSWTFFHPDSSTPVANEVWVPRGKPVLFRMTSSDVLHSFFIPAFRVKRDVVPGVQQLVWFEATEVGDYDLFRSRPVRTTTRVTARSATRSTARALWGPASRVCGGARAPSRPARSTSSTRRTSAIRFATRCHRSFRDTQQG